MFNTSAFTPERCLTKQKPFPHFICCIISAVIFVVPALFTTKNVRNTSVFLPGCGARLHGLFEIRIRETFRHLPLSTSSQIQLTGRASHSQSLVFSGPRLAGDMPVPPPSAPGCRPTAARHSVRNTKSCGNNQTWNSQLLCMLNG